MIQKDEQLSLMAWQLCLDYLEPRDLLCTLQVGKELNAVSKQKAIWKKFAARVLEGVDSSSEWIDYYSLTRELTLLKKTKKESVLSAALGASSTDAMNQTIHETTNAKYTSFWSSTGCDSETSEETLCYLLSGHLSIVDHIKLTFYQADYQEQAPIYYCKGLQILIGHPNSGAMDALSKLGVGTDRVGFGPGKRHGSEKDTLDFIHSADYHYQSQIFEVAEEETQTFKLDKFVSGSIMKIVLYGKTTKQMIDDMYYVCAQRMLINGHTAPGMSQLLRRMLLNSAVQSQGYVKLLRLITNDSNDAAVDTEVLASDAATMVYFKRNSPVDYTMRGVDSTVELLNRQLNLLTDLAVKKYGPEFTNTQSRDEEFCADMLALKEIYERFKQSTMQAMDDVTLDDL